MDLQCAVIRIIQNNLGPFSVVADLGPMMAQGAPILFFQSYFKITWVFYPDGGHLIPKQIFSPPPGITV